MLISHCVDGQTQQACIQLNTISKYVNDGRIDTKAKDLFFYTSPEMRGYMDGEEAVTGKGYLSYLMGGYYFLHLEISVGVANAAESYGQISKRSELLITFLNGKTAKLRSASSVKPVFDEDQLRFIYKVLYPISGSQIQRLMNEEVDTIRILWSTGVEAYEVYYVDFFRNHFSCIKSVLND